MKKKILMTALMLVMALSTAACGKEEAESAVKDKETVVESVEEKDEKEESPKNIFEGIKEKSEEEIAEEKKQDKFWKTMKLDAPVMEDLIVREVTLLDPVTVKVGTPPFNYNVDEIEQKIKEIPYITDNYVLSREKFEQIDEFETYAEGDFHDYKVTEYLHGYLKDEDDDLNDFFIAFNTDYSKYDKIHSVTVYFYTVKEEEMAQEGIASVLKAVYGEEIGHYAAYATTDESNEYNLDAIIESENGTKYGINRQMKEDYDGGIWEIAFYVYVKDPGFSNKIEFYDGDQEPLIHQAKYNMSLLTQGNVSDINLDEFSQMFPEYTGTDMGGEFVRNKLETYDYRESILDDGTIRYSLKLFDINNLLLDYAGYESPYLDVDYTIKEKDGQIDDIDVHFAVEGIGRCWEEMDAARAMNIMKEQVSVWLPGIALNKEETDSQSYRGDFTYLGVPCEYRVGMSVGDRAGSWNIYIKSKTEY